MKLVFSGDRRSTTIKIGRFIKKLLGKRIVVMLWDNYPSKIYFSNRFN